MLTKPRRIKDSALLKRIRHSGFNRCQICGKIPSQTHHIKSKGSGGNDVSENIVRICASCHDLAHKRNHDEILFDLAIARIREEGE